MSVYCLPIVCCFPGHLSSSPATPATVWLFRPYWPLFPLFGPFGHVCPVHLQMSLSPALSALFSQFAVGRLFWLRFARHRPIVVRLLFSSCPAILTALRPLRPLRLLLSGHSPAYPTARTAVRPSPSSLLFGTNNHVFLAIRLLSSRSSSVRPSLLLSISVIPVIAMIVSSFFR